MELTKKKIDLTFTLGRGSFGADGSDTVKITGCRVEASISKEGGVSMSNAQLRVFGVPLGVMNQLSILGTSIVEVEKRNSVTIEAGDENGLATCFVGLISECWIDGSGAPEISLIVIAYVSYIDKVKPVAPISFNGSFSVAVALSGIAAQMTPPLRLENDGVNVMLRNGVYNGPLLRQVEDICRAAHINFIVDEVNQALAIWPKGQARSGLIQKINKDTGMQGYPIHTQAGITINMNFNPTLAYGTLVEVESILTANNGQWAIFTIGHEISSETVDGPWMTTVDCQIVSSPEQEAKQQATIA